MIVTFYITCVASMYDLIVIGGGAAGIFALISAKESNPSLKVGLLEKTAVLLSKVRISGGGRCNVTHAAFDPEALSLSYPRGQKELIGPFYRFQPKNTIDWFTEQGVELKTEADGRMFPTTDNSETIINALLNRAKELGCEISIKQKVEEVTQEEGLFCIKLQDKTIQAKNLILATGSSKEGYLLASKLGHTIEEPVPSLFTFNVPDSPLRDLSGISLPSVELQLKGSSFKQRGPLLITHFGFSGPAVLKLSAFAARFLHEKNYQTELQINWLPAYTEKEVLDTLLRYKKESPQKTLFGENLFCLPKNLWKEFLQTTDPALIKRVVDIPLKALETLRQKITKDSYQIDGKTTHKEEFVTAGGVVLKEVHFKTMESKLVKGLFFAGEILNIDGITGGFNFQNAWTTGFIAGNSIHL